MARTASKSPLDEAGKPASITSTRMRSSARAMRSFSSRVIEAPGALLAVAHGGVEDDQVVFTHGMVPWPFQACHNTDCRQECLARGAQQQAAQREKREREKSKDSLLHGVRLYSNKMRW
jgi:hypothetical protein